MKKPRPIRTNIEHDPNKQERAIVSPARRNGYKTDICALIAMGYADYQIIKHLTGDGELKQHEAKVLIDQAKKKIETKFERYASHAARYNTNRLIQIVEDNYIAGNHDICLRAIDLLNKMGGLYKNNIEVNTDAPVIQLSFGGDAPAPAKDTKILNDADFEEIREDISIDNINDTFATSTTPTVADGSI